MKPLEYKMVESWINSCLTPLDGETFLHWNSWEGSGGNHYRLSLVVLGITPLEGYQGTLFSSRSQCIDKPL